MNIDELIQLSRKYGSDPEFVLGGGGNTSEKLGDTMFVKASGTSLAAIDESGFVSMRLDAAQAILRREYSTEASRRESEILDALMRARSPGQSLRPSVETILHALFPFKFVVHTHPCLVNGLLCSQESESAAEKLFDEKTLWLPYTTPGYVLSRRIYDEFNDRKVRGRVIPNVVLLQNHGIFVGADSIEEIDSLYSKAMANIRAQIKKFPDRSPVKTDAAAVENWRSAISALPDTPSVSFAVDAEIAGRVASRSEFETLVRPFSPDHIVYAGARPLFVESTSEAEDFRASVRTAWDKFISANGFMPKIVAVEKLGIFARGDSEKNSSLALALFSDAIGVARYSESFGGPHYMDRADEEFIKTWEVEQYRAKMTK